MADEDERGKIREALVQAIIRAGAEGTTLDSEDCEVLKSYGMREISYDEMVTFFRTKAAQLEKQMNRPQ